MKKDLYCGYTNWDTWNCALWLNNTEWAYRVLRRCFNSEQVKRFWIEFFEGTDDIDTEAVNFQEVYESIKDEE
jgi:hypothetical protein